MAGEDSKEQGTIWEGLRAPFPKDSLKWRVGATSRDKTRCMALAYMDARMVMRRLDEVVGEASWSTNVFMASDGRCVCKLTIRVGNEDNSCLVERSDASGFTQNGGRKGFGYGDMVKGAASEAFKRAAAQFGIGRYLYDLEAKWVPYDERTKQITAEGLEMLGGGEMDETAPVPEEQPAAPAAAASPSRRRNPGTHRSDGTPRAARAPAGQREFVSAAEKKDLYRANFRALEAVHGKDAADDMQASAKFEPVNFACSQLGADRLDNLYADQVDDAKQAIARWQAHHAQPGQPQESPADDFDEVF